MYAEIQLILLPSLDSAIDFSPMAVAPDTPLLDVIALMNQCQPQASSVLVVENSQVVGWLTDRDIVRLLSSNVDFKTASVNEVMATSVIALKRSDIQDITSVLSILRQHQLPLVSVVNDQGQLVGCITRESICQALEPYDFTKCLPDKIRTGGSEETTDTYKQTEERLRLLESAVVNANDAILITEADALDEPLGPRIVYVNEAFTRMTGWSATEAIGKTPRILQGEKTSRIQLDRIGAALQSGLPIRTELINYHKNGSTYWVEVNIVLLVDRNGKTTHFVSVQRDISERKSTEEALRSSEERFRAIFNGTFQFTGLLTPEGIILEANQTALDFAGLQQKDVVGRPLWETRPWTISTETQNQLKQAIALAAQGEFVRYEVDVLSASNTVANIDFSLKPIKDDTGLVVLLITEGRNITELNLAQFALKQANQELEIRVANRTKALKEINRQLMYEIADRQLVEEHLRQSQEMLQLIMDNIPQYVFWKDTSSVYLGCNRNFARKLGLDSPQDIVGKTDYDLVCDQQEADFYRASDAKVMETDTPEYHIIESHRQKDGKQLWLETNKVPLHDAEGYVMGILGSFDDITERQQAIEALEKSEERFRFLAESIPQQVWISQPDGKIEYVNQRMLDYFACTLAEILGWKWQRWLHPDDLPKCFARWNKSLTTGEPLEIEFRWLSVSDQTYRWHLGRALPLRDKFGQIVSWFGTNTDIDDHKQVEEALKHSTERFRNLVETSSDLVWEVDENAVYTYVSPQVYDILGYQPPEVLGLTLFDLMPEGERERIAKIFASIAAFQRPFKCLENTNIHKDGYLVVLETSGVPVFDALGIFRGYRGVDRDITVRKQAEAALRETQERLQAILDNTPTVIYVTDTQNRYLLINRYFEQLFYVTQEQIVGKSLYDIWSCEIADGFALNNQKVLVTGMPVEAEEVAPREDGQHTYFSVKFPLKDANGVPYAVCGISTDITERKRVEESLLRFRKAIDSTSDAIGMADCAGQVIYVNPAFIELFEYNLEQLQTSGGAAAIFSNQEELKVLANVTSGKSWRGEVMMQTRNGRIVQIELRANAIKDASGNIVGSVGIFTDITERKRAEESLRLRDRAMAACSNGIVIADVAMPNSPIIYANPAFERITGYSAAEIIGKNCRILQGADTNQSPLRKLRAAIAQAKTCTVVLRNYRKDGSLFWNQLSISPVHNNNGKFTHYIGILTDITKRKQAETALLVSQERLQYLLSSSPGVIYSGKTSGDYGVTFISENVVTMTGYEAREFLEDPSFWRRHIHPEDTPRTELPSLFEQGDHSIEYRFLHKDGTYRWVYDQAKLVRDNAGIGVEIVGYWADITKLKQLEQNLRDALEKEKELNQLKSRFISMTSHEFRTPLSTILSSSELLEHYRHKWTAEKQITHLHRIQTAVKHMTEMLSDVLVIAKGEAGRLDFRPAPLDLVEYCLYLVEESQLNVHNQHKIAFGSPYQSMPCCMDEKLLGHILSNLLSNAIKYSPTGSTVKFTLTCQQGRAIFEIQDQGIGIPPEDLPRLFESFYRATNVGNIQGTGLGLAIVKKCVDIHKGEIAVTSKVGVGTTFTVTLPLVSG